MRVLPVVFLVCLACSTAWAEEPKPPPPPSSTPGAVLEPPPPPAPGSATDTKRPAHPAGWARPTAFASFGLAAAVLTLGIVADAIGSTEYVGVGYAQTLTLAYGATVLVGGPVAYIGGHSARFDQGIVGSRPMRVLGWLGYGACLLTALISLGIDALANAHITGFSTVGAAFGAASFTTFGLDALWSAQEAEEVASIMSRLDAPALQVSPRLAMLRGPNGTTAPSVGVGGRF